MAKLLKLRRGNTSQHGSFTGAEGEVTVDTDKDTLVVHDGSQVGGRPLLREDLSNLPAGQIDNADINASAAIAGTKISPDFGSQNIVTSGTVDGKDISALGITGTTLDNGVTATTQSANDNSTKVATTAYTDTAISNLVDSSPAALNTLNELAAALGDDANFSTTVNNNIAAKMPTGGGTFVGDVTFDGETAGRDITFDRSHDKLRWEDNAVAAFGTSSDLQIYYDGSHSYIANSTNNLYINAPNFFHLGVSNGGDKYLTATENGAVELFHDGGKKLETDTSGSVITGRLAFNNTGSSIQLADDQKAAFGAGQDLQIHHTGSHSHVSHNGTGNLYIDGIGSSVNLRAGDNAGGVHPSVVCNMNAGVDLYYDNNVKLATSSTGVSVTGALVASGDVTAFSDQTLKKDITTINDALGLCGKLRGVSYKWIKDDKPSIGVIAQEIEQHIPEIVTTTQLDGKDVKSVDYGKIVGVLINAVNELKAELDEYKATFETIKLQDLGGMDGDEVQKKILVLKKEN